MARQSAAEATLSGSVADVTTVLRRAGLAESYVLAASPTVRTSVVSTPLVLPPAPPPTPAAPPPPPTPPLPPASPPGICSNTCNALAGNPIGGILPQGGTPGVCDDGGAGSTTSACPFGTDCEDCGVRIFCTSCPRQCQLNNYAFTNQANACLERDYANRVCTQQCNNLACAYDGNDCTPAQIERQCTTVTILDTDFTQPPSTGLVTANGLVPVALLLQPEPVRLTINEDYGEMMMFMALEYTIQWQDARLFNHPCYGALNGMLSLPLEAGRSDNARFAKQQVLDGFWVRKLSANELAPAFDVIDESTNVTLSPSTAWSAGYPGDSSSMSSNLPAAPEPIRSSNCENCVTRIAELELDLVQKFDFYYYPFDTQTLKVIFEVEEGHIYTCQNQTAISPLLPFANTTDMKEKLLPFTDAWQIARETHNSVQLNHPVDPETGEVQYDKCELRVIIKRNYIVFLVKNMVLTILVVAGSLITALWMHPEELVGDRFAVLFIGFLILVTNMQTDLGLGAVNYLLWIDFFNLVQLMLILIAVAESAIVHILLKSQQDRLATSIDKVLRYSIPFFLYPILTMATIIVGLEQFALCPQTDLCGENTRSAAFAARASVMYGGVTMADLGNTLTALCMALTVVVSLCLILYRSRMVSLEQLASVNDLVTLALANLKELSQDDDHRSTELSVRDRSDKWSAATERVFKVYDLDGSGSVDFKELRGMVVHMYPEAPAALIRNALIPLRQYADADGDLDVSGFQDAVAVLMEFMAKEEASGNEAARPLVTRASQGLIGRTIGLFVDTESLEQTIGLGERSDNKKKSRRTSILAKVRNFGKTTSVEGESSGGEGGSLRRQMSRRKSAASLPKMAGNFADIDADNATPCDPMQASICIIRTTGSGQKMGDVTGANLPADVGLDDHTMPALQVVANLVTEGFTVASTTPDANNPAEMVLTLVRKGGAAKDDDPFEVPRMPTIDANGNGASHHHGHHRGESAQSMTPSEPGTERVRVRRRKKESSYAMANIRVPKNFPEGA